MNFSTATTDKQLADRYKAIEREAQALLDELNRRGYTAVEGTDGVVRFQKTEVTTL